LKIKTVFKSNFKICKSIKQNKSKKIIFVKNLTIFLLFSKIFFRNCIVSLHFLKEIKNTINLLKAPSRHKQFFHQVYFEIFKVYVTFSFKKAQNINFNKNNIIHLFKKFNNIFLKIGSNTLTRVKFSVLFNTEDLLLLTP